MPKTKAASRDPIETLWCGVPRYECPICGFDSLDAPKVREHLEIVHPAPGVVRPAYSWTLSTPAVPVTDAEPDSDPVMPKWYADRIAAAQTSGESLPSLVEGETQRQYEERVAAMTADDAGGEG